jgi:hypothetical protein
MSSLVEEMKEIEKKLTRQEEEEIMQAIKQEEEEKIPL